MSVYDIPMDRVIEEFADCWKAAGRHLQTQAKAAKMDLSWLKADLRPPILEHLSFRIGNQLFYIRIEDVEEKVSGPGNPSGLLTIAVGCKGHPCLMQMSRTPEGWGTARPGWGLVHAQTGAPVYPPALVSDEPVEMTDWELHDFGVQMVRQQLEKEGRQLMSWQGNPAVDPSIWFIGDEGPEWVVVRVVRYPRKDADPPANMADIARNCAKLSEHGNFASVSVASANDPFDGKPETLIPLWRGDPMYANFHGLQRIISQGRSRG